MTIQYPIMNYRAKAVLFCIPDYFCQGTVCFDVNEQTNRLIVHCSRYWEEHYEEDFTNWLLTITREQSYV